MQSSNMSLEEVFLKLTDNAGRSVLEEDSLFEADNEEELLQQEAKEESEEALINENTAESGRKRRKSKRCWQFIKRN